MSESRKILKVFLASPGDLADERQLARQVVNEVNQLAGEAFGCQIELVGWEDTLSVFGRPQATINQELERCEYVVGMMWKKWGTAPALDPTYTSGFEEEFRISMERKRTTGRPEISMLFKHVEDEYLRDPGEQLRKVISFKKELVDGKEILFESFENVGDFERKFRRHMFDYLKKASGIDRNAQYGPQSPKTLADDLGPGNELEEVGDEAPKAGSSEIFRWFVDRVQSGVDADDLSDFEVARLRLVATVLQKSANDSIVLGAHDANLMFNIRNEVHLSEAEINGLINCGLDSYLDENVPLWFWLTKVTEPIDNILIERSIFGSDRIRVSALNAMTLVRSTLDEDAYPDRESLISNWLAAGAKPSIKLAALQYLARCGLPADVAAVRAEFNRADSKTSEAASGALISIALRDGRDEAIRTLLELRPATLAERLVQDIFSINEQAIAEKTLLESITQPAVSVRRAAVKLLKGRNRINHDIAEKLLLDPDPEVIFAGISSLAEAGRVLSESEAKAMFAKVSKPNLLVRPGSMDSYAEKLYDRFRRKRLAFLKNHEVEILIRDEAIYSLNAYFELLQRQLRVRIIELREIVEDGARKFFDAQVDRMREKYGGDSDLATFDDTVSSYLRTKFLRRAVDILCDHGDSSDISRIRRCLIEDELPYSDHIIRFLGRFGEWKDVEVVLALSEGRGEDLDLIVSAVFRLGRGRLTELVEINMPDRLFSILIKKISDRDFRNFSGKLLLRLMRNKSDVVRKAVVIRCVRSLPKIKLSKLMADYLSGDKVAYYNVVHWLDFGVSMSRARAMCAAGLE